MTHATACSLYENEFRYNFLQGLNLYSLSLYLSYLLDPFFYWLVYFSILPSPSEFQIYGPPSLGRREILSFLFALSISDWPFWGYNHGPGLVVVSWKRVCSEQLAAVTWPFQWLEDRWVRVGYFAKEKGIFCNQKNNRRDTGKTIGECP